MDSQTVKVLCIEDEHFISELYARALTKAGYEIKVIFDGEAGLQEMLSDTYDIILLDLMVPGMSGFQILERLRALPQKLKARLLIITNLELNDIDRKKIEDQADGYIIKAEITPHELVDILQNILPAVRHSEGSAAGPQI